MMLRSILKSLSPWSRVAELFAALIVGASLLGSACGGNPSPEPTVDTLLVAKSTTADAGPDHTYVLHGQSTTPVLLDGSRSAASGGAIVSYVWTQQGNWVGSGVTQNISLGLGDYAFQLEVTDDSGTKTASMVKISVVEPVTYHVSKQGNDAWSGKLDAPNASSNDGPFLSIQKAVSTARAGTTIVLNDGVYSEQIVAYLQDGIPSDPIILKAADGAHVILDGQQTVSCGIRIFHSAYWVIQGFECQNFTNTGVLGEDADNLVVRLVTSHDNNGPGILVMASDDVLLEWNEVYGNGLGMKVGWETIPGQGNVRSNRPIMRYNLAHDNLKGGGGADGIDMNGGDFGVLDHNLVWQNYDDGIDNSSGGNGGDYATGQTLSYNASWRNGPPMACPAGPGYAACVQCPSSGDCGNGSGIKTSTNAGGNHLIHHNLAFSNTLAGFDNDQENDWGPNRYYNNTAYGNEHGLALDMAGVTSINSAAAVLNNLLVHNNGSGGKDHRPSGTFAMSVSDYNFIADGLFPNAEGAHSLAARNVVGDPKLVNPDAVINTNYAGPDGIPGKWQFIWDQIQANFAIQSSSPCHNAGTIIPGVTDGYAGSAPDMGAVELPN